MDTCCIFQLDVDCKNEVCFIAFLTYLKHLDLQILISLRNGLKRNCSF